MMAEPKSRKPRALNVGFHPPPQGGMAAFIANLENSKLTKFYDIKGFDTDHTRWFRAFRPVTLLYLPFMYLKFWWVLMSYKPDVVHIHTPAFGSFYKHEVFLRIAKKRGLPVALHVHAGKFKDFYDALNERKQRDVREKLLQADLLIVLSNRWRDFFCELYPKDRIRVVENGIDLSAFPKVDDLSRKTGRRFLYVGRIHEPKGIDELLHAISEIVKKHPDIRLTLVGGEKVARFDKVKYYQKKCNEMGISENVMFTGELHGEELIRQYMENDVFVLPSHAEGMPLVLLEAMASSLPCIATNVGAIPEILNSTDKPGGIIIPPKDVDALKSAMLEFIENPDRIESMGRENRRIIEERYSFDVVADKICSIYDELIINS